MQGKNLKHPTFSTCPICHIGTLIEGLDPEYLLCNHCQTEIAINMEPRPAADYEVVEWYGSRWEFDIVASLIKDGNRVLELGCGEGHFSRKILEKNIQYQGVDFNCAAIMTARSQVDQSSHKYLTNLELASTPSDTLCAFHVIEHIPEPINFLRELLKKNQIKRIFFSVPNPNRATVRMDLREKWDYPPHHLYRFTESGLREMMRTLGFKEIFTDCEPMRNDEFMEIAEHRTPKWIPSRMKIIRSLHRWFSKIPHKYRPRLGQAMLMAFVEI